MTPGGKRDLSHSPLAAGGSEVTWSVGRPDIPTDRVALVKNGITRCDERSAEFAAMHASDKA